MGEDIIVDLEWYPVPDYPKYVINRDGVVKKLAWRTCEGSQRRKGRKKFVPEKLMAYTMRAGYLSVNLRNKPGIQKGIVIHRILAKLFVPNPDNKPCVNHINGIKTDNRIENLEWCTTSENTRHAYNTGLAATGAKHWRSKLNEEQVKQVFELKSKGVCGAAIARQFGVCKGAIYAILGGVNWKQLTLHNRV